MDEKRFDSLTKALAKGANRRNVLKGLLGLGGAAVVGGVVQDGDSEAARRPTNPTPTPVRCPGQQFPCGNACCCPAGLSQCAPPVVPGGKGGPDCCNSSVPVGPGYSECCDQACCFYPNDCVGEELCCPRLPEVGCLTPQGTCCTTLCEVTPGGVECCPADDFCPGGSTSPDRCCNGDTPIKCDCGTNGNICLPDTDEACCIDADCDTPPAGSTPCVVGACTSNHVCVYTDCNASTEICCPDNLGVYACRVGDECCLKPEDCADTCEACVNFVCVDDPLTFPCGPSSDPDKFCCPETNYSVCCGATQFECCGLDSATGITRECDADGKCCEPGTPNFCAGNNICCAAPCIVFGEREFCCDPAAGRICPNATSFVCCPNGQECSADGDCCPVGSVACGDECCPVDNICCPVVAPVPVDGACCPSITQCNLVGRCCPADFEVCGANCCDPESETPQCCNGNCVAASVECCNAENQCDGECETCEGGQCVDDQDKCFGACGLCVDGTCKGDDDLCLDCEICRFDPQTKTGTCVNNCTGCAECRDTELPSAGVCVPVDSECLSCQLCQLNSDDTGGTCVDNCPGCETCFPNGDFPAGICRPDSSQCTAPAICCDRTNTCVDLALPLACCVNADCDSPPDGCSVGTCGDNNVCSYQSTCAGECCPGTDFCKDAPGECCDNLDCTATGPDACLIGTCLTTHLCSYTPSDPLCGDCGVCSATGVCSAGTCDGPCELCLETGDTNRFNCEPDSTCCTPPCAGCQTCQPGQPGGNGTCEDDQTKCTGCADCLNAVCVPVDTNCAACQTCVVTGNNGVCDPDCDDPDLPDCCVLPAGEFCIPDGAVCCDANGDCPLSVPICDIANHFCVECLVNGDCRDTGEDACLIGTCNLDTNTCSYAPNNSLCGDCGVCSAAGICSAGTCDGPCELCLETGDTHRFNCEPDSTCCTPPCAGCQTCQPGQPGGNGTCEDDQTKCTGCADCLNAVCVPVDTNCAACQTCVVTGSNGVCDSDCDDPDLPDCCVLPAGEFCIPDGAVCCDANGDCPESLPICDIANHFCVQCLVNGDCTDIGEDACLVGTCSQVTHACSYAPNNDLCIDTDPCTDGVCSAAGFCSFPTDCNNDPTLCCPGCFDCSGTTCVANDGNCTSPPNTLCWFSPGDCGAGGDCTYPQHEIGFTCGVCQDCNAAGECVVVGNGTADPDNCAAGQVCCGGACTDLGTNANCLTCGNTCPTGQSCVPGVGCEADCIPVEGDCSGGGTCCAGTCCNGTCETTFIICAGVCFPDVICCPEGAKCVYDPANENAGCCGNDFCCNLPEEKCKANPGEGGSGRIGDPCTGGGNCCSACCSGGFCAAPSEC